MENYLYNFVKGLEIFNRRNSISNETIIFLDISFRHSYNFSKIFSYRSRTSVEKYPQFWCKIKSISSTRAWSTRKYVLNSILKWSSYLKCIWYYRDEAERLSRALGCKLLRTSVKEDIGVMSVFRHLASRCLHEMRRSDDDYQDDLRLYSTEPRSPSVISMSRFNSFIEKPVVPVYNINEVLFSCWQVRLVRTGQCVVVTPVMER